MTTRLRLWLRAVTLRSFVVFAIAVVASVVFVVISAEVYTGTVDRVDTSTELAIHRLDSPIWDFFMKGASLIGSSLVLIPVVLLVMALAIHRHRRAAAVILALDTVAAIVLDNVLKLIFARDRPTLFDKIDLPTTYSFPSGHSMSAMAVWGVVVAVLISLYPRIKRPTIALAVVLIGAIGFSRIYLGVHWPFDVLGGFVGGIPLLVVSVHLLHRRGDRSLGDVIAVGEKP